MSDSKHLLVLSIGPVQGFIAAARKTRDLWFGSHLLSEVAKAAAKAVLESGGELIFPDVENADELTGISVANVILAEVSGDPQSIADKAKKAAEACWKEFAKLARQKVSEIAGSVTVLRDEDDLWQKQIDDFLEFQVAWCRLGDYKESRQRVMKLLAGRKACRDFSPGHGEAKIPKSSLDGARESVLCKNLPDSFRKNLHLRNGEQLDAIGVVKRFAGGRKQFSSLGLIAIDPIIRDKKNLCESLEDESVDWDDFDALRKKFPKAAEKSPYMAILLADGDRMGKAISEQDSAKKHRELSKALSGFAQGVEKIVKSHHGECVYAGGDDVLAFLPLDTAIDCARQLHDDFAQKLSAYDGISLSVGIVVGHYHEMLENLLEYARSAEKMAKKPNGDKPHFGDRDGLAIRCYSRGNAPISIREQWQEGNESIDKRLDNWAELFADKTISMKFPYDLRELVRLYEGFDEGCDLSDAISKGAVQVAKQKQIKNAYLLGLLKALDSIESLKRLVDEMMVAQTIGVAVKLRKEKGGNNEQ